jgi:hypothetical protein
MVRISIFSGILFILAVVGSTGCGTAYSGPSGSYASRDVENLALRLRHVEDRLSQIEESMGGLASKTFSGNELADTSFSSAPMVSSYGSSLSGATHSHKSSSSSAKPGEASFIVQLQTALAHAGYDPGPADGVMGYKTTSAMKSFQRDHKLKVTGTATSTTWKLLSKYAD